MVPSFCTDPLNLPLSDGGKMGSFFSSIDDLFFYSGVESGWVDKKKKSKILKVN